MHCVVEELLAAAGDVDERALGHEHLRRRSRIEELGGSALDVAVDVTNHADVRAAVDRAAAELGSPTVLLNGAGIIVRKDLLHTSPDEWARVLEVNLTGSFNLLQAVVPPMAAAGADRSSRYTAPKGAILH